MTTKNRPREVTLRFLAGPTDMNVFGNVHGGAVMKWIDEAAYICASGWSGQPCVTVYVGGIRFYKPVHINELVEVHARLIYTGHTSMHIAVDVSAGDPKQAVYVKTTHCVTIFVALDEAWRPEPVEKWIPITEEDRALEAYARKLMDLRKGVEAEMRPYTSGP
jgi:acyl-CoA hydrolase